MTGTSRNFLKGAPDDDDRTTTGFAKPCDRQGAAAPKISRGAQQAAARRRQRPVSPRRGAARALSRRSLYAGHAARDPKTDHVTFAFIGGGFAGLVTAARLVGGRHQGCPHHREGRRLRRHLVLEPLSGRAMRYRVDGLHAAARRNRPHAVGEIRACAGNPRALPAHRQAIRPLRQRAVPHRGREPRLGRGEIALDHPHQSRRCLHRAVRRHGHRAAACAEAARHRRHRVLQGALVPHQPLGLRLHRRRSRRAR